MSRNLQHGLVAHWPMLGDLADCSPCRHATRNHHVTAGVDGAVFNGRDSFLEVQPHPALQLGAADLSIVAEIHIERNVGDVVGDIVSHYDHDARSGYHLSIKHLAGVVSSQPNYRHLQFEIDDGSDPQWSCCGRPGHSQQVWGFAVHQQRLYAATMELGRGEAGHVYRYEGGQEWRDCGSPDESNTVSGLAVYQGQLYAATQRHDAHGSLLPDAVNQNPGGRVFRYAGGQSWIDCGTPSSADNLLALGVFDGRLFTAPMYAKGIFYYRGGTTWAPCAWPDSRLFAFTPYHGDLYVTANRLALLKPGQVHVGPKGDPSVQAVVGTDGVFQYDERQGWIGCGNQGQETQIYGAMIYRGQLFVSTWPSGKVFCYQGGRNWQDCGRLGQEQEVMSMAVYNGRLYAGSLPSAEIYRYESPGHWVKVGQVDTTPDVPVRRAFSMAIYQGKLFVGTLPSGTVHCMQVGQAVTADDEMPAGWSQVAAVRRGHDLHLYRNGQEIAASTSSQGLALKARNEQPLTIGFGAQDYFAGRMRDVRLYNRALTPHELSTLSSAR
ncbi:MAG: LamG domain-containing protein [Phycisphaeraceae bacterium]|nr:LamG domain-containing protein [Phycisphaeraceae bacterium]